jgi:hypothetical protein
MRKGRIREVQKHADLDPQHWKTGVSGPDPDPDEKEMLEINEYSWNEHPLLGKSKYSAMYLHFYQF